MVSVSYKVKVDRIDDIVKSFYVKATSDFLIGYQFRKIQTIEGVDPTKPPIEAFSSHLPRIASFWRMQLLGEKNSTSRPFNLINVHKPLSMKKGELGRWVILFKETLNDYRIKDKNELDLIEFYDEWEDKISWFEKKFLSLESLF